MTRGHLIRCDPQGKSRRLPPLRSGMRKALCIFMGHASQDLDHHHGVIGRTAPAILTVLVVEGGQLALPVHLIEDLRRKRARLASKTRSVIEGGIRYIWSCAYDRKL